MTLGNSVILIDCDPQASALDWSAARQRQALFPVVGYPKPSIHKDIGVIADGYDYAVIDSPPRQDAMAKSVMLAAAMLVIPVQPSPYDVWAAEETLKLVEEATVHNGALKSVFAINRKIVNDRQRASSLATQEIRNLTEELLAFYGKKDGSNPK